MEFHPGHPYHVYNRTNAGRIAFPMHRNYLYFSGKLKKHVLPHAHLIAYCLMPTHFHLLLIPKMDGRRLNYGIGVALRSYTRALQRKERFHGSLFQQRTKARLIESDVDACIDYIHMNPVKARFVDEPERWLYSSHREYVAGTATLCDVERGRWLFPEAATVAGRPPSSDRSSLS
jgi:putative transposase